MLDTGSGVRKELVASSASVKSAYLNMKFNGKRELTGICKGTHVHITRVGGVVDVCDAPSLTSAIQEAADCQLARTRTPV